MLTIRNITKCARCHGVHEYLEAKELERPFAPEDCAPLRWTHWVACPTNGEPILIALTSPSNGTPYSGEVQIAQTVVSP